MTRIRALIVIAIAALAALALAACGGDDGGDEDPKQVLEATFNNEQQVDSGVIDLSFDLKAEGDQAGEMSVTLGGPFQDEEGSFSKFDIEAEASFDADQGSFSGSGGLISTGDRAFVNFQGTDYEVPQRAFRQFAQTFTRLQQQNNQDEGAQAESTQQLVDSFTDLSNEGNEDVDGTETTHVSGELDVAKFTDQVRAQIQKQSGSAALPKAQLSQVNAVLDQLDGIVKNASMDVYSGTDDDILRKLDLDLDLETPQGDSVTVGLSLSLSGVNEPQEIVGPTDAKPLNELLQQLNIDPSRLGQLGAALGSASSGAAQAGGSPAAPSSGASQAYLECLQTAETSDALQQCAALLE
ncbi:MAG TPA: hypothetical protein VFN15_07090 [Solirubrobacterales bacterium]|nr:hypothetical protein [Solirubrobacterales bacterium]